MPNDLNRIANAVEHIAYPAITHELKTCTICRAKKRPVKKMPQSVILTAERMRKREEELRRARMLSGPEEPVADMFRYRELKTP
jgi:hypothetical protein